MGSTQSTWGIQDRINGRKERRKKARWTEDHSRARLEGWK